MGLVNQLIIRHQSTHLSPCMYAYLHETRKEKGVFNFTAITGFLLWRQQPKLSLFTTESSSWHATWLGLSRWCKQTSIKLPRYDTKTSRNWRTLDSIETRLIDIWACLAQIQRVTEGDQGSIDGSDRQSGRNKTLRAVFVETVSPNKGYPLVRRHTTTNRWTSVCAVNHHPRQEKPQLSNVIVRNAPVHGKTDKLSWQLSIIAGLIDRLGHRYDSEQDVWKLQIKNRL